MKFPRITRLMAGLVAAALVISCTDRTPTAAPSAPSQDLLGGLTGTVSKLTSGVLACQPLPYATATKTIGPLGGVIVVGPHVFTVPPGALTSNVTITATAPSDNSRSVEFSPAGLHFRYSAALALNYDGCGLLVNLLPKVAYTDNLLNILYYVNSVADGRHKVVVGQIDHFSRYAAAY